MIFFPTECTPILRVEVVILHFGARGQKGAVCFECFSFSGRGLVTSYSGEFGGFYLSTVRCAVKRNTSSRRRRQLHKWSDSGTPSQAEWNGASSQASRNGVFVKSGCRRVKMWSRAWRLSEVKTCVFVIFLPKFWAKKWGGRFRSRPLISLQRG